ncbi:MAG: precorrin-2 C(20)-methyltransferase [Geminicoccales bacterium]
MITGRLLGIGVGPGDPELLTLKALRYLQAAPVIAFVSALGQPSIARQIAAPHLLPGQREINIALPMHPSPELAEAAYEEGASRIGTELERGRDVAVLCEGDPLMYGSFAHLLSRLVHYPTDIVPGIASITAAAAAARSPLVGRTDTLAVLPATLPKEALRARLDQTDAAAILKVGRHIEKVRQVLAGLHLLEQAIYVEHVSTPEERVMPLIDLTETTAPYFSLVLIPRRSDRGSDQ